MKALLNSQTAVGSWAVAVLNSVEGNYAGGSACEPVQAPSHQVPTRLGASATLPATRAKSDT